MVCFHTNPAGKGKVKVIIPKSIDNTIHSDFQFKCATTKITHTVLEGKQNDGDQDQVDGGMRLMLQAKHLRLCPKKTRLGLTYRSMTPRCNPTSRFLIKQFMP